LTLCAKTKIGEKSAVFAKITHAGAHLCQIWAMRRELDEFDLKLLDALQRNSRLTADELAEQVSLSPSSVQRRLRRLRDEKIIEAEVAIVLPDTVGRSVTAIVQVTLDTDRSQLLEEFQRAIEAAPEIMQGFYVTGNTDFILVVTANDMQNYEQFADRLLARRRYVKHFHTSVVLRRIKWGVTVPVQTPSPPAAKRSPAIP
jgi:Lrp/AsnC family leucine-responsive transcriptional regulator